MRVWRFVASVCFRSPEAYAASLACPSATAALAQEPFIPVKREQHNMVGQERALAMVREQCLARGVDAEPHMPANQPSRPYESVAPAWLSDATLSGDEWADKAVVHIQHQLPQLWKPLLHSTGVFQRQVRQERSV